MPSNKSFDTDSDIGRLKIRLVGLIQFLVAAALSAYFTHRFFAGHMAGDRGVDPGFYLFAIAGNGFALPRLAQFVTGVPFKRLSEWWDAASFKQQALTALTLMAAALFLVSLSIYIKSRLFV